MKAFLAMAAAAALLGTGAAHAVLDNAQAEALMKKDNCALCHAIDKKLVGPVVQRRRGEVQGRRGRHGQAAEKVKEGGSGVWGSVPMPPNAGIKDADIKELVAYILTLKK